MTPDTYILLIDDDADDRDLFCDLLLEITPAIPCFTATDCSDALLKVNENWNKPPAVIFLDMHMPKTSGMECISIFKKEALLKDVPIIMYSGSCQEKDVTDSLQLGAYGYLVKHPDHIRLKEMIRENLSELHILKE